MFLSDRVQPELGEDQPSKAKVMDGGLVAFMTKIQLHKVSFIENFYLEGNLNSKPPVKHIKGKGNLKNKEKSHIYKYKKYLPRKLQAKYNQIGGVHI